MYDVRCFLQLEGPVRYYRALYDYDPFYHSPNEEDVEDELGFKAGDIIIVSHIGRSVEADSFPAGDYVIFCQLIVIFITVESLGRYLLFI